MRVSIAGGGRGAWMAARLATLAGWEIVAIALRDSSMSVLPALIDAPRVPIEEIPPSDLVFVALSDDGLDRAASSIAGRTAAETGLVHLSGSRSSEVFSPHRRRASLHPLAALPQPPEEPRFPQMLFVAEGDRESTDLLREAAEKAGARFALIDPATKPLYHAAAVMASNYVAMLAEVSHRLIESAGVHGLGRESIASLARSALANWETNGIGGTTGPIARRDIGTIERNLLALEGAPDELELYAALGSRLARAIAGEDESEDEIAIYQEIAKRLERDRSR